MHSLSRTKYLAVAVSTALGTALGGQMAMAQTSNTAAPAKSSHTSSAAMKPADPKPIQDLESAAQKLRDAIHAMAQAPVGEKRTQAIKDGNHALGEVNDAVANLPPDMLTAQAKESDYTHSLARLEQAAQRLRDATHALAQDPNSKRRDATIRDINKALRETQQVMIDVPVSAWGPTKTSMH